MIPVLSFHTPVIAHRGASANAPENTLAAVRCAREQGATWLEVDVKITGDGVPILMHDETLDRTTNGFGPVADADWESIKKLDAGGKFGPQFEGEPVPLLKDVVSFALENNMKMNIELKPSPGRARATTMVTLIEMAKYWPERVQQPLISSMDIETLEIAAQLQPPWPRGLILDEWREDWVEIVDRVQATSLSIRADHLTPERLNMIRIFRIPILAYTINDPLRAQELLTMGVTAVYTDKPKFLLDHL